MALYLGPRELERLFGEGIVTPGDCVEAVAASFREHGTGSSEQLPRHILWADPDHATPRDRALKLSASMMRDSRVFGASVYSTHYKPGEVEMWNLVFDGEDGRMAGVIHGKALSLWKTAATAAVATQALARQEAARVALIGSGRYALAQLTCLAAVRDVAAVRCHSRDPARLAAFVERAGAALPGVSVTPETSARAAVADADIVTTITTSPTPVLEGAWVAAGTHVNAMGQHAPHAREVDSALVRGARVVVDTLEQALIEKGELLIPLAEGSITREHIAAELGAVVAGRVPGRSSAAETTLFCSGGTALEYMALARMVIERARQAGIGRDLEQ
ncbi:MAG: ornithine cyclodeaminase family protein [Burkholderiales bacterium]|nr:ornithine cyclodeaminase family protein [Burkholderiales bacterium]